MADLIVVTGGSCSGKTSVIHEMAARGYEVVPEAAYEVIDELNRRHGVEGQIQWRQAHLVDFQRRISERQHAREATARRSTSKFVFCDRGLLDGLAYCQLAGLDWPDDLHLLAESAWYGHVFVLATLAAFDRRADTGRIYTEEASVRVALLLQDIYGSRARQVTRVPEAPVAARADLMLETLGLPTET
ncbi:MAG: AAA family ATPase [Planctomycetota bacterium]